MPSLNGFQSSGAGSTVDDRCSIRESRDTSDQYRCVVSAGGCVVSARGPDSKGMLCLILETICRHADNITSITTFATLDRKRMLCLTRETICRHADNITSIATFATLNIGMYEIRKMAIMHKVGTINMAPKPPNKLKIPIHTRLELRISKSKSSVRGSLIAAKSPSKNKKKMRQAM
jgi:hypothetical protein